ncbi:MAG: hypothetical protein CBD76_02790 [Pelagibacteraceae bacterium TMED216]|nr:MAG: hypothetical protein CBD76_02790 [Pelagibacteraceae bacterium TMED216]|tara:strand:- start:176 stop:391 length:216 start_codon:yes stop_codon:yes gene_type:complete
MSSNYKLSETEYFSKETEKNKINTDNSKKRVNLNDLVDRMNIEKKKDQRTSILFSVSAISALIVFGIILTL